MALDDWLKKNKKIHYICKALKHINDKQYVDFYLDMESDPRTLLFKKYGEENKDKAIYLITENGNKWGFFAEFRALLCKLYYAERMGFVPYIYWGSNFLYYEPQKSETIPNAYEYYFGQPTKLRYEEIQDSYMVCQAKSAEAVMIEREHKELDYYGINLALEDILARTYHKYIRLNEETQRKLEGDYKKVLSSDDMLGVHFRGTDYQIGYNNHPVYVQIEETISVVKDVLQDHKYQKIFLATDDKNALKEFLKEFGRENIQYYDDVCRGDGTVSVALSERTREFHHYLLGYEVLRDMLTLSKCQGLVSGVSQVTNCARIAKKARGEQYLSLDIIYHGVNHNERNFV